MSLIYPARKFKRATGIPQSRRQRLEGPLREEELSVFRSWLTQAGSLLASNAVKTALVKTDAITQIVAQGGSTNTSGEFDTLTIVRTKKTDLIILVDYIPLAIEWNVQALSVSNDLGRVIWINIDNGGYFAAGGSVMNMYAYHVDNFATTPIQYDEQIGLSGGLMNISYVDEADRSGEVEYDFKLANLAETSKTIDAWAIVMLERKR